MKLIQRKIGRESFISRLPSLFAYIEEDDVGVVSLHMATDAKMGCYGKVVENIELPEGINLTIDGETLLKEGNTYTYRTLMRYYYQYKDELGEDDTFGAFIDKAIGKRDVAEGMTKMKEGACKVGDSDAIEMEFNDKDDNAVILARATEDSTDKCGETYSVGDWIYAGTGCKVADSDATEFVFDDTEGNTIILTKAEDNGTDECNEEYSEGDWMYLKEIFNADAYFDDHDLCQRTVSIACAAALYDEYVKMWKACKMYEIRKESEGPDEQMCCYCEKFERMGGEDMMNLLDRYAQEAVTIAEEYYGYASDNSLNLQMSIFLSKSEDDLGLVTPYIEEWEGGKEYHACESDCINPYFDNEDNGYLKYAQINGDKVYYDGKTYTTKETNRGKYNETTDGIDFYYEKFTLDEPTQFLNVSNDIEITGKCASNLKSLRRYASYLNAYDEIDAPDDDEDWLYYYRKGLIYNLETVNDDFGNILMFDSDGEPIQYSKKDDDSGNIPANGETVTNLLAYGDIITDITYTEPSDEESGTITFTYVLGAHLTATCVEVEYDDDGNPIVKYENFKYDEDDKYHGVTYVETHSYDSDGDLADLINGERKIEYDGNTISLTKALNSGIDDCGNSYATGAWIDDTTGCVSDVVTVADEDGTDDCGNEYNEGDWIYTASGCKVGDANAEKLEFNETVILDFDKYINGDYDITSTDANTVVDMYTKYEFSTISDSDKYTKRVGYQEVEVDTVMADFYATNKNAYDWQLVNTTRLDYLKGISMQPLTDIDVSIQRGITAVYEKNLKFAEVKTLEDMENYANGSFFPMIEGA